MGIELNPDGVSVKGCKIIYAPAGQAGEYAPLATNPYRGCGNGCAYCLEPDTIIQMADGTTKHLADIEIGDKLLGVDPEHRFQETVVENKILTRKPPILVSLSSGQNAVCSTDHRWLTKRGWVRTRHLSLDDEIRTTASLGETPLLSNYRRGWLPAMGSYANGGSRIIGIQFSAMGSIDMLDITTSTENFIANGMVSHNCYVPLVTKQDRKEFDAGTVVRDDYLGKLRRDAMKYKAAGVTAQVMLSFTTDPYPPPATAEDPGVTRSALGIIADHGLGFCTLTKGGTRALRDIDLFRPTRDAFASTLTSLDDRFSKKWERNAALPGDRLAALKAFHKRGIFTWVSLEPTLDVESSLAVVDATHEFVDLYKVGRVNYLPITKTTNWEDYTHRMIEKLQALGKTNYIKKDLQKYLPPGYHNPLRVPQHH